MGDYPEPTVSTRTPVFTVTQAAARSAMHPQTVRQYDRLGLVTAHRTAGRDRRYSLDDVAALQEVQRLVQQEGVNLAGVKRILALEREVTALREQLRHHRSTRSRAVVVRRPLLPLVRI